MTNRRTKRLFGYSPVSVFHRSGAFLFYTVGVTLTIGYFGLQGLFRIAKIHFKVYNVFMDDNLFDKGMYEAFLGICRGLVEILHGKLQGFVEVVARIGGHVGCRFLDPQFGKLIFQGYYLAVDFRHLGFIGRALGYGTAHRQIQQGLGLVLALIQPCLGFRNYGIDASGHKLSLAHGIAYSFEDDIPVLGGHAEIIDQRPVKDSGRDTQLIASEFLFGPSADVIRESSSRPPLIGYRYKMASAFPASQQSA